MRKESVMNFIYSIGAAIVILGALFKINHWTLFGISASIILAIGLITEAIIFVVFAFDPPKSEESYAWENVYPELLDKNANPNPAHSSSISSKNNDMKKLETSLSEKLDNMLKEAKMDVSLFERLKEGINGLSHSVSQINQNVDVSASTVRFNEQMNKAADQMQQMNSLFSVQMEQSKSYTEFSKKYVENLQTSAQNSEKFNEELTGLSNNLNNLNKVYGGMLSAMKA